jgi:hypothetical protein
MQPVLQQQLVHRLWCTRCSAQPPNRHTVSYRKLSSTPCSAATRSAGRQHVLGCAAGWHGWQSWRDAIGDDHSDPVRHIGSGRGRMNRGSTRRLDTDFKAYHSGPCPSRRWSINVRKLRQNGRAANACAGCRAALWLPQAFPLATQISLASV